MATGRNFSYISPSVSFQQHNRNFPYQESHDMDSQGVGQQHTLPPSPNQNFLSAFYQGPLHNPEIDLMKQMSPLSPTSPQNESKGILSSSRIEQTMYSSPTVEVKAAAAGPPKHGIGNLSSSIRSDPATQELLIDSSKHEPGDWVTVFGFPPAATSMILSHFSECGSIEEKKSISGSNWIHLKYASKIESRRALSKNGSILNSSLMIGVVPYNSEGGHPSSTRIRYLGPPKGDIINSPIANTFSGTIPTESQPGLLNKTFEYLFGW